MRTGSLLAGLALSAPLCASQVIVVDEIGGPGVDFTQIFDAVAAASPGDTILVHEGYGYIGFTVDGMGLNLVAERGVQVVVNGTIEVRNLPADQSFLVHGIEARNQTNGAGLELVSCQGPVWVEDGVFSGPELPQFSYPGILIEDCQDVSINRTQVTGSRALNEVGGAGLEAIDSNVYLYDVALQGGHGTVSGIGNLDPGPGASLTDGFLYAAAGEIVGGDGFVGATPFGGCVDGGPGATGMVLSGSNPSAHLLDLEPQGGPGGTTIAGCSEGPDGAGTIAPGGSVLEQDFPARFLSVDGPLREGETITIDVEGQPGDAVFLFFSLQQGPHYVPPGGLPFFPLLGGAFQPDIATSIPAHLGTVGFDGTLQATFPAGSAMGDAVTLYSQAVLFGSDIAFTSAQSLTVLNPAF